jgi:hypothetical protein
MTGAARCPVPVPAARCPLPVGGYSLKNVNGRDGPAPPVLIHSWIGMSVSDALRPRRSTSE